MISLLDNVDTRKTVKLAKAELKTVPRLVRLISSSYEMKVTQTFSLELKTFGTQNHNGVDDHLAKQEEALEELTPFIKAINCLNADEAHVLNLKYFNKDCLSDIQIWNKLACSDRHFYRMLNTALLNFAEAYKGGELMKYKK